MTAQILAFPWPCDLEWTSQSFKLESYYRTLVVSCMLPGLKQLSSQVSQHRTILSMYLINSYQHSSLPENSLYNINLAWTSTSKQVLHHSEFHTNRLRNFGENGHQSFSISHTTVTFDEGQGHPNRYQNVEFSGPYYHIKIERNRSVSI